MSDWCAHEIITQILQDLKDRRGLRQAWEDIESDIQQEIASAWRTLVEKHLTGCRYVVRYP